MRTINIPGFTAETSLAKATKQYRATPSLDYDASQGWVVPQCMLVCTDFPRECHWINCQFKTGAEDAG
jgi:hypothetical protein